MNEWAQRFQTVEDSMDCLDDVTRHNGCYGCCAVCTAAGLLTGLHNKGLWRIAESAHSSHIKCIQWIIESSNMGLASAKLAAPKFNPQMPCACLTKVITASWVSFRNAWNADFMNIRH